MRFIDAHAHLHEPEFAGDLDAVLDRARAAGMAACVTVGTDLTTTRAAVALAEREPDLFATLAVHPHDARHWDDATADEFRHLSRRPGVVAIGETGLDFFRNLSPPPDQHRAFEDHLALAAELRLPVVIHSRQADEATYDALAAWASGSGRPEPVGVIHCFSADLALAFRYIDLGFMISIAGPVTYPKADALGEVVRLVPLDMLTVETDAPFLPPQSHRGQRNEPLYVLETIEMIAALRGESAEVVGAATADNAARLFRIPSRAGAPR